MWCVHVGMCGCAGYVDVVFCRCVGASIAMFADACLRACLRACLLVYWACLCICLDYSPTYYLLDCSCDCSLAFRPRLSAELNWACRGVGSSTSSRPPRAPASSYRRRTSSSPGRTTALPWSRGSNRLWWRRQSQRCSAVSERYIYTVRDSTNFDDLDPFRSAVSFWSQLTLN